MPNYLSNYSMNFPEYIDPNRPLNFGAAAPYMDFGSEAGNSLGSVLMSGLEGFLSSGNWVGAVAGAGMNLFNQYMQNQQQESFYNAYMTPQARMRMMKDAGINPNAAAAGIAGSNGFPINAATASESNGVAGDVANLLGSSREKSAQIKNLEANTNAINVDTAIKAKELGGWDTYRAQELKQMQSEIDEKVQSIEESKQRVNNLKEELNNIKKTYDLLVEQVGETKAKAQLEKAEAAVASEEAKLKKVTREIGYAPGTPEYNLTKAAMDAAVKGVKPEEYEPYKQALQVFYDARNAGARGEYDSDPGHQTFRESKDAIVYLQDQKRVINNRLDELKSAWMDADEEDAKKILSEMNKLRRLRGECDSAIKGADRAFKKESYKNGYHTQWQNSVDAIVKGVSTGIGIGIGAVGTAGVGQAFGASKAAFGKSQFDKGYSAGSYYGQSVY